MRDYIALTKPRITWLILMSTGVGYFFGLKLLNASIPRDVKVPEGSGDSESSQASQREESQRAVGEEAALTGANQ
jgi:hypothetical protein